MNGTASCDVWLVDQIRRSFTKGFGKLSQSSVGTLNVGAVCAERPGIFPMSSLRPVIVVVFGIVRIEHTRVEFMKSLSIYQLQPYRHITHHLPRFNS